MKRMLSLILTILFIGTPTINVNAQEYTYSAWSDWQTTAIITNDTTEVETRIVDITETKTKYSYEYWRYWNTSANKYYYKGNGNYGGNYYTVTVDAPMKFYKNTSDGPDYLPVSYINYPGEVWFNQREITEEVITGQRTEYRSRTKYLDSNTPITLPTAIPTPIPTASPTSAPDINQTNNSLYPEANVLVTGDQIVDTIIYNGTPISARYTTASYDIYDVTYNCASLIKQFYSSIYGIDVYNLLKYQTPMTGKGRFDPTNSPRVGDIVRFDAPDYGHWAIVKAVSGDVITIIEQSYRLRYNNQGFETTINRRINKYDTKTYFFTYSDYIQQYNPGIDLKNNDGYIGRFYISPLCAPDKRLSVNNDIAVIQSYDAGQANQYIDLYKKEGNYYFKFIGSGKYMDVAGGLSKSGTKVQQYKENNTKAQKWKIKETGDGYYYIISLCGNYYLDVKGGKSDDNTGIQIYKSNKTAAQKWIFQQVVVR